MGLGLGFTVRVSFKPDHLMSPVNNEMRVLVKCRIISNNGSGTFV